ncbi:MAG: CIA30 family protein [Flavobacteriaceae bacterium]|nr:CIA30 family protein [Flavobacteriaceae bacterium]
MIVNDSVMGGLSRSQYQIHENYVSFRGNVSLKNNGGFASLRMIWPFESVNDQSKLRIKVKGDGSNYQFRLRTNRVFDGASYVYEFRTIKDQWLDIEMKAEEFIPSFRGRVLRNMPALRFEDVQQMGILIADKQKGEFEIGIKSIELIK